jgi:Tfp pilus assembly protein PilX
METDMKSYDSISIDRTGQESGAALVMVLLISFLLGTAAVAMLTAAGASARNSTDVLSETKAYYAAESGIQAAVNALRFGGPSGGPVNYKTAVNNFANSGTLSTWLTYLSL